MPPPWGDTVVVCRPDQLREAAVVVSCLPADRFHAVVTVAGQPISEAEQVEIYRDLYGAQSAFLSAAGTLLEPEAWPQVQQKSARLRGLLRTAGRYRSWARHNEMVSYLTAKAELRRAVFLFEPLPGDLNVTDPGLTVTWREFRERMGNPVGEEVDDMFAGIPRVYLLKEGAEPERNLYLDMPDLARVAWRLLRDAVPFPEEALKVPAGDAEPYVGALFAALGRGVPLLPVDDSARLPAGAGHAGTDSDEAVLVENSGHAETLLAALYAHHRGARLVVVPPPALDEVRQVIAERQDRISSGRRGGPLSAIEEAVTRQVPPHAVAEVGDRRLTAFTTGLPYSFVRTADADWSGKPIGHVAADPTLIVLNEIYGAADEPPKVTFSLIFDPGFFATEETEQVMATIAAHWTYPLLLLGADAGLQALLALPKTLPVEFIFFNTHGTDESIVLGDVPLERHLIPQWLQLRDRPIVFNSSCESWTGVGREFIRVGARGYVGTLWSVPAKPAAELAWTAVRRLAVNEMKAAEALVGTGSPDATARSYIFVGTANTRFRRRTATRGNELAASQALLEAARGVANKRVRWVLALNSEIYRTTLAPEGIEQSVELLDVLLDEIGILLQHPEESDSQLGLRLEQAGSLLEHLPLTPDERAQRQARLSSSEGRRHQRSGRLAAALTAFRQSLQYDSTLPAAIGDILEIAQILTTQGDHQEAAEWATRARESAAEHDDLYSLLAADGLLGQLSRRRHEYDQALDYARQGFATATRLELPGSQGAFKLDESMVHQARGDLAAAIAAATEALGHCRRARDDAGELTAYGRLGTCHRTAGELGAALEYATKGLRQAERLGESRQEADFHLDLGEIHAARKNLGKAIQHMEKALEGHAEHGRWELLPAGCRRLCELAAEKGDFGSLWQAVALATVHCGKTPLIVRANLVPTIVRAVKRAVESGDKKSTVEGLTVMWLAVDSIVSADSDLATPHVRFLGDFYRLTLRWVRNEETEDVMDRARYLDEASGGALEITELVAVPYREQARGKGAVAALRRFVWRKP